MTPSEHAEIDNYIEGRKIERERVIAYLKRRMDELDKCGKDDSCNDLWHFTEGLIEDLIEGEY